MKVNLVIVFNKNKDKVLMCQRRKDPYKGKLNFVGGKVQKGESSENQLTENFLRKQEFHQRILFCIILLIRFILYKTLHWKSILDI
jgi:8-oxo-dGTP pyrophosphatase MutT (NUDIX family)